MRKLRARSMPPAGRPRPTEAAYDGLDRAPGNVARSRCGGESRSRPHRYVPPAESHGISERDSRSARPRDRRRDAAAERRLEPRLRQHQRRRAVADAARALSVGRAENQPPRRRHAGALGRRRDRSFFRRTSRRKITSTASRSARAPARACGTRFRPTANISSSFASRAIATS